MWLRKWIPVRSPSSTTARCRSTPVSRSGSTRTRSTDTAASRDHRATCRRLNRCVLSLDMSRLPSRSRALVRHQLRTLAEVVRRAAVRRASASSRWSCCVAPGRCARRAASDRAQRRSLSVPASASTQVVFRGRIVDFPLGGQAAECSAVSGDLRPIDGRVFLTLFRIGPG